MAIAFEPEIKYRMGEGPEVTIHKLTSVQILCNLFSHALDILKIYNVADIYRVSQKKYYPHKI